MRTGALLCSCSAGEGLERLKNLVTAENVEESTEDESESAMGMILAGAAASVGGMSGGGGNLQLR